MIRIGVIGYGYWGPNLTRNFYEADGSTVVAVSDFKDDRIKLAKKRYPSITTMTDPANLINDPKVDVVAVATPVSTHFDLAMSALKAGKHVLVEKPLAMSGEQCDRLNDEAAKRNLIVMVDHTFIYTGAVKAVKEMIDNKELGNLFYYDSVRINLGLFQHDVDVIWDLAVHDLSIMDYIFPCKPVAVSATGSRHVDGQLNNIAYLTLYYEDSFIAHIHVNWLAPVKLRRTLIGGDKKMVLVDELNPGEKVKVYDKGVSVNDTDNLYKAMSISYRMGDMWAPKIEESEALKVEANHLAECINKGTTPLTDGVMGGRVVKILEAASKSMANRGALIELNLT